MSKFVLQLVSKKIGGIKVPYNICYSNKSNYNDTNVFKLSHCATKLMWVMLFNPAPVMKLMLLASFYTCTIKYTLLNPSQSQNL